MDKERTKGKKVAIITSYGENFGNRLQNYAVQQFLKQLGFESISSPYYEDWYEPMPFFLQVCRRILHFVLKSTKYVKRRGEQNKKRQERLRYISTFSKQYLNCDSELAFNRHSAPNIKEKYDYFIAGSDQIWHGVLYTPKEYRFYFLEFADQSQRFTFAPSFALNKFPWYYRATIKKGLLGFKHLSIREERSAKLIKELTGQEAVVLLDPTLLVDTSEWDKILKKPSQYVDDNYILIYSLGVVPDKIRRDIHVLAGRMDAQIIDLMDGASDFFVHTRPDEFLYWIHNAKLVVTDSFHASVFSILFNRPFVTFDRTDVKNMESRFDVFSSKFKLESRRYAELKDCFASDDPKLLEKLFRTDYSQVAAVLEHEREKAKRFFEESFFGR